MPLRAPSHRPTGRTRSRLLAGAGLVVLLGGFAAVVLSGGADDERQPAAVPAATTPSSTTPGPKRPKPKPVPIPVKGVGAYDPDGDRSENDSAAPLSTDGVLSTAWTSERYRRSFTKTGVGLVLDAGQPVRATRVVVSTETPGYTADVRIGSSPTGPFASVSKQQSVRARTTFALEPLSGRYVLMWITSMPEDGAAAVNEITVSAGG